MNIHLKKCIAKPFTLYSDLKKKINRTEHRRTEEKYKL